MSNGDLNWIANFIWGIADDVLRDFYVKRAEREISLLREYRSRLTADVVTGKLDVHATAAKLPKEVDEPEPFDEAGALSDAEEEAIEAELVVTVEEAIT